ncbi:MAG TPA: hypothetical protein VHC21_03280 [Candidatus Saccharimonadales bacterium]|nr:hypothetical protein [Candidatus Saccharimonadales bacterium]
MAKKTTDSLTVRALQRYAIIAVAYVLLIFILPANRHAMHAYQLTGFEYRILYFAVALPSLAVWFAAFYGYAKLQEYARAIKRSDEAPAFSQLARGCMWLAWSLPVSVLVTYILNVIADQWGGFHAAATILANYTTLALPLIGFSIVGMASKELIDQVKIRLSPMNARGVMLFFVIGGVLYCYLTFRRFDPSSLGSTHNPYFLPIWVMLLTVIIPYLYAWFVGLLAAYEITSYSQRVRGVLYKQALRLLVGGLVTVIVGSILVQYVSSVEPSAGHLELNYRLLLIVIFRIIIGIGFVLIAAGANRLKKIEEV